MHQSNYAVNSSQYTLSFDPALPGMHFDKKQIPLKWDIPGNVMLPANKNELAFYSIRQLASLLRNNFSAVALTRFFIERLKKFGDTLHCVISITEDIAMKQAAEADANFATGIYKSPLQGIPYGIKKTYSLRVESGQNNMGSTSLYKDQQFEETAFVCTAIRTLAPEQCLSLSPARRIGDGCSVVWRQDAHFKYFATSALRTTRACN